MVCACECRALDSLIHRETVRGHEVDAEGVVVDEWGVGDLFRVNHLSWVFQRILVVQQRLTPQMPSSASSFFLRGALPWSRHGPSPGRCHPDPAVAVAYVIVELNE